MSEDMRCCGSGTCIIDPDGRCWCGQQWDGTKMAAPSALRKLQGPPALRNAQVVEPDIESPAAAAASSSSQWKAST